MRKIAIFFVLGFLPLMALMAQNQYVDIRLSSAFSEEYLEHLEQNIPQKIDYLNYCLDNSFIIVDMGIEKAEQLPYLKYFDPINKIIGDNVENLGECEDINIHLFDVEKQYDKRVSYRIGDTGKAMIFKSQKQLVEDFKKYQDEE